MNPIIEQANCFYIKYGADDLGLALNRLKIKLFELPLGKIIKEVYFKDLRALIVDSGLNQYEKRHLIAHALGHHILHKNRRANYFLDEKDDSLNKLRVWNKEREAELFAAYFLVPKEKLDALSEEEWIANSANPVPELAEEFQVPEELMKKRLEFREMFNY